MLDHSKFLIRSLAVVRSNTLVQLNMVDSFRTDGTLSNDDSLLLVDTFVYSGFFSFASSSNMSA